MKKRIEAIDLFCGAGGLSCGLSSQGICIKAGIDLDPYCEYPFTANHKGSKFLLCDVAKLTGKELEKYWSPGSIRLLVGCAPCQPFSTLAHGKRRRQDEKWYLLEEFARLVEESTPDLVTMENVPGVRFHSPFQKFQNTLKRLGYQIDSSVIQCSKIGVPQRRSRFVLVASRLGAIKLGKVDIPQKTVREAIGHLPKIHAGETDRTDSLHKAKRLSEINLKRIKASRPGGTWREWPESLRSPCHLKKEGSTFGSVYARMEWDKPSPTITTQCNNYGTGRFGHPEQDRAISLREAALLQSFPEDYQFVKAGEIALFNRIGRLIGNAVPPKLGEFVGKVLLNHILS